MGGDRFGPFQFSFSYVSSHDALLGHHEDEADEDGRPQHADGAHQRVGSLRPLAAQARGGRPYDHAQQARHAGDGAEDEAGEERKGSNAQKGQRWRTADEGGGGGVVVSHLSVLLQISLVQASAVFWTI